MNTLLIIGLSLVFLGSLGGIIMFFGQQQSSTADKAEIIKNTKDENLSLKTQLTELKDERSKLKQDLETRDKKVAEQNDSIVALNNKLIEKSDYITNFLTGGGGYPTIKISSLLGESPEKDQLIMFHLDSEWKWPLYDIRAILYNFNKIREKGTFKDSNSQITIKRSDFDASIMYAFDENSLLPHSNVIGSTKFSLQDGLIYIQIKSRSSFVFQKMAFVKKDRFIYSGSEVHDSNGRVLLERFTPETPEDIKQKIREKFKLIPNRVSFSFINA